MCSNEIQQPWLAVEVLKVYIPGLLWIVFQPITMLWSVSAVIQQSQPYFCPVQQLVEIFYMYLQYF